MMELSKARLCLDCEWVDVYQDCPKCGSKATHLLVNFLSEERLFVAKEEEKGE
jgi:hypothetical protein